LTSLYSFADGIDGANPSAPLTLGSDGNFYGTAYSGGSGTNDCGTVFEISPAGVFTCLYSFSGGVDGAYPAAALVQGSDGWFYGTARGGGDGPGDGTVFRISVGLGAISSLRFSASPTNGSTPLEVQFNSPNADSSGVSLVRWSWNFGDGSTSAAQNPSHTYTSAGTFIPQLAATNSNGLAVIASGPFIQTASINGPATNVLIQSTSGFGLQSNQFAFQITGPSGALIVVQAATNLLHPFWLSLSTNILTGGAAFFNDSQSTNYPSRFYRLQIH
jgi:uncharacterized repeat protein (TIGR03803 family)